MRVVFIGTPALAASILSKLIESRHEIAAVVTQPDKASGRGRKTIFSPVKQTALDAGLPILQPASLRAEEAVEEICALKPDLLIVTAYSQLLPERLLNAGPYGCINVHPSLLPKYRGAAPLVGPILNGEEKTGVTIMKMCKRLDSGDMLLQEELPLDPKETPVTLIPKAAEKGAAMLLEAMEKIEAGTITATPQKEEESTYIGQLEKEDGHIRFENSAKKIEQQIRACTPWPSAFTHLSGKVFKIWDADVLNLPEDCKDAPAGSVVYADKKTLLVACGEQCLKLNEVQMEGKKRMGIEEFLRGRKLEKGFQFG